MLKKKVISVILLFIMIFSFCLCANAQEAVAVSAKSAVLIEAETGKIIFSKNETEQCSMASTTKIMTALLALESGLINKEIKVTAEMLRGVEGTSIGLKVGDTVDVKTLIYGMLLDSGNDAANVTAFAVSGSIDKFVRLMNERALQIGMKNTCFVTPSGLDAETHFSTAYDMALLGAAAIKNPQFAEMCSTKTYKAEYGNPVCVHTFSNHNRLLTSYDGAFGIKTGFTKKSGRCLVSAAQKDGVTLVAVTLNAPNDWSDHKKMLDYGFSVVSRVNIEDDLCYNVDIVGGNEKQVKASMTEMPSVISGYDLINVKKEVYLKSFEYAPIEKGDILGCVRYLYDDTVLCEIPLTADDNIRCITKEKIKETSVVKKIINKIKVLVN